MSPRLAPVLLAAALAAGCATAPVTLKGPDAGERALRDPRVGAPVTLERREERLLSESLEALARSDQKLARRRLASGMRRREAVPVFRLAGAYADFLAGEEMAAAGTVDALLSEAPHWTAALETRGDLAAARGDIRTALDAYRYALRTLPRDARLEERVAAMKKQLVGRLADEASAALGRGEMEAARRAGLAILELDPSNARGFRVLAEAAVLAERWDDAWSFAERARALEPDAADWLERAAEIAARSGRHGEAAALYDRLAERGVNEAAERAAEERLAFQLQNLPETARRAAESPRLTRGQAAVLVYWLVAEVRESPVPAIADVATDVVDRADRTELVRAIALGLLAVSETHHVGPETVMSRSELAAFLRKLGSLVARGGALPPCLSRESTAAALVECGILRESAARSTSGREAMEAIERVARAGREGGLR